MVIQMWQIGYAAIACGSFVVIGVLGRKYGKNRKKPALRKFINSGAGDGGATQTAERPGKEAAMSQTDLGLSATFRY